jgi:hypothetical protein
LAVLVPFRAVVALGRLCRRLALLARATDLAGALEAAGLDERESAGEIPQPEVAASCGNTPGSYRESDVLLVQSAELHSHPLWVLNLEAGLGAARVL